MQRGTKRVETRKGKVANKIQSKDKIVTCAHAWKRCFGEVPSSPWTKIVEVAP